MHAAHKRDQYAVPNFWLIKDSSKLMSTFSTAYTVEVEDTAALCCANGFFFFLATPARGLWPPLPLPLPRPRPLRLPLRVVCTPVDADDGADDGADADADDGAGWCNV